MLELITTLWISLFAFFAGSTGIFYIYLRRNAAKPWNIEIDENFEPSISIIVPTHNEEKVIEAKLQNLKEISYPRDRMEIIIADDASTDATLQKVQKFVATNPQPNIKVVSETRRLGKAGIMNKALEAAKNEVIVVSDADSFWPSETLTKSLPFLSSHKVGAITGLGVINNSPESWITSAERNYLGLTSTIRLGESKIHSTIRFEGGFCAYLREAFEKFDDESGSDDSGTALEIVQRNYRTIIVPEAVFYTNFPKSLIERIRVKSRRAHHLICLWMKCLKLLAKKKLRLTKKIAIPEIILFIFNPIVFLMLSIMTVVAISLNPFSFFSLAVLLLVTSLLVFSRKIFTEVFFGNLILLYALLAFLSGKRYVAWEKAKS